MDNGFAPLTLKIKYMPTIEQLGNIWNQELQYPETRHSDDPMYRKPKEPEYFKTEKMNQQIDWQNFKVRCSAIHCVLSNSRSNPVLTEKQAVKLAELQKRDNLTEPMKIELADLLVKKGNGSKVILSDTCIAYLMAEYAWKTERMVPITRELLDVPQMTKGTLVEADSLLLLSKVDGVLYRPNMDADGHRERICNDYLSGEVDAYLGESIMTATVIPDVKSIWDYPTFLCKIYEPLTNANDWQIKGYMDISGASEGFVANCLTDTPPETIEKIKYKLLNKMNVATEEATEFKEKWETLERSMTFSQIPEHKRVFKKKVEPMSDTQRQFLYDRVKVCREWLNTFHETYQNINL